MTLKDFFTLAEIKDGLTDSDRVKELINLMLEEDKDCAFAKIVANTISITENKDCLNRFVELNGLSFINKWLEETQNSGHEESIFVLLNAVEKLKISYEQSMGSGIRESVEKLISHSSVVLQEKAKALFGSWEKKDDAEAIKGLEDESGQTTPSDGDIEPNIGIMHEEKDVTVDDDKVDEIETRMDDEEKALHHKDIKEEESVVNKPFEESECSEGEYAPCHLEGDPSDSTSTVVVAKEDGLVSNRFSENEEHLQKVDIPSEILAATEIFPSPMEEDAEPRTENDVQNSEINVDDNLKEPATSENRAEISLSSEDNNGRSLVDTPPNNTESMEASPKISEDYTNNVLGSSGNYDRLPKIESPEISSSSKDSKSLNSEHSNESESLTNKADFFTAKAKGKTGANKNMSDFELNYGLVDPLEVARLVANEVEREVEGRRERSCSSSSKKNNQDDHVQHSEIEATPPSSPIYVHRNETQADKNDHSDQKELDDTDVESSQLPDDVQATANKPPKGIIFDLNEDICCSDDTDQVLDMTSAYVSIVSASRAAAAGGFPATPLQFEGAHGWKGSAATSAFRAASPRKSDTIDNNSKSNQNLLDFDLNMSEDGEEKAVEIIHQKQFLHTGESSGEGRVFLDLNHVSDERDEHDEGDASVSRITERLLLRNSYHNASPSSSSSSMRNFDLNDQPSFLKDNSELNFFANSSPSQNVVPRSNGNVISIMGTKVVIDQKPTYTQPPFLPNGRVFEPTLDINRGNILGISSPVPYPHPSMLAYNGLTTGPTGAFMYGPGGPIPYMVDYRGGPMVPQLMGSQPPFIGNFGMHPPGFNGSGPSRPSFDLNLGFNRETSGVLRQFLGPDQNFQPSSSAGKRKEPDGGWEQYPLDYKHHQWK